MHYVNLGATGLQVSRVCLGTMSYGTSKWRPWVLDEDTAEPIVRARRTTGSTSSTPPTSTPRRASEEVTGRLLGETSPATRSWSPPKCSTACPARTGRGLSRKHVMAGIDASLKRLGMDYVDLYQIHRWDPETPIEETLEALDDVVRAGKARYIGAPACTPGSS